MVLLGELLEQVVHQRRVDGSCTDSVDTDVLRTEVDRKASGDLSQCAFGQSVAKAMRLADEPLVRSVDDHG